MDFGGALQLPPGFRFHPTDDELVTHYLLRKCAGLPPAAPVIAEVDLYRFDPWQLPERAVGGEEKEWYFFSPRDRKYPNGSRPNRAAGTGYWKATGADKPVGGPPRAVAIKKALVFYAGKPPRGVKTNWIMHEYRLADVDRSATAARKRTSNNALRLDDWVLCRIYNKKGVIERYNTVDDDDDATGTDNKVAKPATAAKNNTNNSTTRGAPAAAANAATAQMKVETHDYYDGYYADDYDMTSAAEMLCFDRPSFVLAPAAAVEPRSASADRDYSAGVSNDDNSSAPRHLPQLHTDNSSSAGSEHVLSPSPEPHVPDRDHAESQPMSGSGWFDGVVVDGCWGGGPAHDDGFVVDVFGMPSPGAGGFASSARDAAVLGEMFAYLQRPF